MIQPNMKLSVILPAYNEGAWIFKNLHEVSQTISSFSQDYEVIVVNDGSTDNTLSQVQLAIAEDPHIVVISSLTNEGKGRALCLGTSIATGSYIAFCDADLDIHPRQLENFQHIMDSEQCDVVIGSKMHHDSHVEYPLHRHIISWGYYFFLLLLFRLNVKDTQTGLKLFRADVIKPVMNQILVKRFAFDIEVLAIINSLGYKIVSAPVTIIFKRGSLNSRIKLRDVINTMQDTLGVFYRLKCTNFYYDLPQKKVVQTLRDK